MRRAMVRIEDEAAGDVLGRSCVLLRPLRGLAPVTEPAEPAAIRTPLEQARHRLGEAARSLGMSRTELWRKMRAYGLRPLRRRGPGR